MTTDLAHATAREAQAVSAAILDDAARELLRRGLPPWWMLQAIEAAVLRLTPLSRLAAGDVRVVRFVDGGAAATTGARQ